MSKRFPSEEKYSLGSQIRRAARSVCANIAEAWKKQRYPASFVSKLSDADSEAGEVQSWLDAAIDCEYISQFESDEFDDMYSHIGAQLNKMIDRPNQWCSSQAKQNQARKAK